MVRIILAVMLAGTLSGCVSYNHLESQRRTTEGIQALVKAEEALQAGILAQRGNALPTDTPVSDASVDGLRTALAQDARADVAAARSHFTAARPYDQISALSRAALKGWQAGAAGQAVTAQAARDGLAACKGLGKDRPKPERDCEIFEVAPDLNVLETHADTLLEYDAFAVKGSLVRIRNSDEDVKTVALAVQEIAKQVEILGATSTRLRIIRDWVGRQRAIYLCHGNAGLRALLEMRTETAKEARTKGQGLLADPTASLAREYRVALGNTGTLSNTYCTDTLKVLSKVKAD